VGGVHDYCERRRQENHLTRSRITNSVSIVTIYVFYRKCSIRQGRVDILRADSARGFFHVLGVFFRLFSKNGSIDFFKVTFNQQIFLLPQLKQGFVRIPVFELRKDVVEEVFVQIANPISERYWNIIFVKYVTQPIFKQLFILFFLDICHIIVYLRNFLAVPPRKWFNRNPLISMRDRFRFFKDSCMAELPRKIWLLFDHFLRLQASERKLLPRTFLVERFLWKLFLTETILAPCYRNALSGGATRGKAPLI